MKDETLSLFGFGVDSFVEVISGIGIWHLLAGIKKRGDKRDLFERRALRITGIAFYILTAGLLFTAIYNAYTGSKPETTFWGIVISLISIASMSILMHYKLMAGRALDSKAIIADANCTKTCLHLSIVLLAASLGYQITGLSGFDSAGAIMIAYLSFKEGKEAFEKAATDKECSCND